MNYGELKERLLEILGRRAMPLAYTMARTSLDRSLRIVAMEKTATLTAASGSLALPADFIEPQSLKDEGGCFHTPTSHESMASTSSTAQFVLGNGKIYLTSPPVDGATFELVYFAKLVELTADGDTNAALTSAPEAFVYSVLAHHAKLIRDGGALQFWEGQALGAIGDANKAAVKARMNGGTLEIQTRGTVV